MHAFTRTRQLAVVGVSGALAASALVSPSTGATAATTSAPCRLVQLHEPARGYDGGVIDIEVVEGRTVYYGSTIVRDKHGVEHQRALVWNGLEGEPVRVGPSGYDEDIAFELTASGLVNGQSMDWDTGTEVAWVQDLRSGRLAILDTGSGPRGAGHGPMWMRRINDAGAVAGMVARNPSEPWTDAVGFDAPDAAMELLPGSADAADAVASGINNSGQRTGYLSTREMVEMPGWYWFDPVVWETDGGITALDLDGALDGAPRAIKDDGSASGSVLRGPSFDDRARRAGVLADPRPSWSRSASCRAVTSVTCTAWTREGGSSARWDGRSRRTTGSASAGGWATPSSGPRPSARATCGCCRPSTRRPRASRTGVSGRAVRCTP